MAIHAVAEYVGPAYISFTRDPAPYLYGEDFPFEIGKAVTIREGSDVTLIAMRDLVFQALIAADNVEDAVAVAKIISKNEVLGVARREGALILGRDILARPSAPTTDGNSASASTTDAPDPHRWLTFAWMWPKALGYFREVRDPQTVSQGDRHYLFYPLWPKRDNLRAPTFGDDLSADPADVTSPFTWKDERIVLDRTEPAVQGSQRFRVSEDLSNPKLRATLLFKAVDLTQKESLELWLNGTRVPQKQITRRFQKTGQNEWQGVELAPFYLYIIDVPRGMREPLIINGDNELTVRLIPTEAQSEGTVTIDELEVYVYCLGSE